MAKKKTFIGNNGENPALMFISSAQAQSEEREAAKVTPAEKAPEGFKLNPLYVETKTRRLQLVLQPSLYDKVKARAKTARLSVNEYVHQILEEATREE